LSGEAPLSAQAWTFQIDISWQASHCASPNSPDELILPIHVKVIIHIFKGLIRTNNFLNQPFAKFDFESHLLGTFSIKAFQ
jgi:hypothetical protein